MKTPTIRYNESKMFAFPVFDFNNQASGATLTPSPRPLQLGTEGYWAVCGISATMCNPQDPNLAFVDGTDVNIQILSLTRQRHFQQQYFFTYTNNYALNGVPIEHVAGKYGNPYWFNYPIILEPGTRLNLMASQFSGTTPSCRQPLYVVLHAYLTKEPTPNLTLASYQHQVADHGGHPYFLSTKFVFSGAAGNNLLRGETRTLPSPMNAKSDFLCDSISVRSAQQTTTFINTMDPRRWEPEILFSVRDSIAQSTFVQPDPVPISLMSGICGARNLMPPTFFHVNPQADIVTTIENRWTGGTLGTDWEITYGGTTV